MKNDNIIGKYFKSKTTFSTEGNIFLKGTDYQLLDVIEEEIFTLYIFKGGYMFGDYDNQFKERFIDIDEQRILNLNKVLYED